MTLTALNLQGQRLSATVLLIKALGGGWDKSELPTKEQAGEASNGNNSCLYRLIYPVKKLKTNKSFPIYNFKAKKSINFATLLM